MLIKDELNYLVDNTHNYKGAQVTVSTSNYKADNSTWHYLSDFTATTEYVNPNPSLFQANSNGFMVLEDGYYHISAQVHFNASKVSGSATPKPEYGLRLYNAAQSQLVDHANYFSNNMTNWISANIDVTCYLQANDVVGLQVMRGNTTNVNTWQYKPSTNVIQIMKLN